MDSFSIIAFFTKVDDAAIIQPPTNEETSGGGSNGYCVVSREVTEVVVVNAIDCEIVIASALPVGGELVGSRCARHCRRQQGQPRDVSRSVINLERQILNDPLRKRPLDGAGLADLPLRQL